jgi:hypothetical protein
VTTWIIIHTATHIDEARAVYLVESDEEPTTEQIEAGLARVGWEPGAYHYGRFEALEAPPPMSMKDFTGGAK